MGEQVVHEIEIVASSMDDIRDVLDVFSDIEEGSEAELVDGATLTVSDVSKSSGFDATTVILTGMVSIAVNTSGALLIDWLKSKLFKKKEAKKDVTIIIDGKKIQISDAS